MTADLASASVLADEAVSACRHGRWGAACRVCIEGAIDFAVREARAKALEEAAHYLEETATILAGLSGQKSESIAALTQGIRALAKEGT
jgi:hypothetical protein